MSALHTDFWIHCEQLLLRDPAGRGLASYCPAGEPLCGGNLRRAVESLAASGRRLAIVTGFCVVEHEPPVAETDGPPGSLYLAAAARRLGIDAVLISDSYGLPLLQAGAEHLGLAPASVLEFPFDHDGTTATCDAWIDSFLTPCATAGSSRSPDLCVTAGLSSSAPTHLISIERPGPSHTLDSLIAQPRTGPAPRDAFLAAVPDEDRNRCHNIRGRVINSHTAPTHRLFETAARLDHPPATIAAIDGGNELGSGSIPWEVLCRAINRGQPARVACRIPTDATIVAGVSDWGGYALALCLAHALGRAAELADLDCTAQRRLIEVIVSRTGAVDGITGQSHPTVDGLPLETYLQTLAGLREAVGLRA